MRTFAGHTDRVFGCAFSTDGRLALTASWDGTLRLWEVPNGREAARWLTEVPLTCCALGPFGGQVVAGDAIGGVHFLEVVGIEAVNAASSAVAASAASGTATTGAAAGAGSASSPQGTRKRGLFGWWRRR